MEGALAAGGAEGLEWLRWGVRTGIQTAWKVRRDECPRLGEKLWAGCIHGEGGTAGPWQRAWMREEPRDDRALGEDILTALG